MRLSRPSRKLKTRANGISTCSHKVPLLSKRLLEPICFPQILFTCYSSLSLLFESGVSPSLPCLLVIAWAFPSRAFSPITGTIFDCLGLFVRYWYTLAEDRTQRSNLIKYSFPAASADQWLALYGHLANRVQEMIERIPILLRESSIFNLIRWNHCLYRSDLLPITQQRAGFN